MVQSTHPKFNVTLHAGDEAGFQWFVKDYNPKIVRLIRMQTVPSNTPNLKSVVWQFRVVPEAFKVQHLTTIELVYTKPWDIRNAKYYSFPVITQVSNSVGSDLRI